MSTTVVEFENQDVIVVEMSGRGPIGPRGRQGEPGPAGPSEWGVIQGNISDQTDLQDALDAKADVGASYTKSEEDALLAQKADADSVYTKTETDALLADKADTDDVYSKTEVNTLLSEKADSDTVYTKTETDTLLGAKADVGDSYTKAEEDILLNAKANSADVYTKTETDTLLADKADADDVYTKTEVDDALADKADSADVYTKDETDTLLLAKAPVILNSASGSIASFSDGSASPVTALSVSIDPVQDLHGYDNPWPAGGGKNLLQTTASTKTQAGVTWTVNADGSITVSGTATDYTDLVVGDAKVNSSMGTVTIKGEGISTTTNIAFGSISLMDSNNAVLLQITTGGVQTTYTTDISGYSTADHVRVSLKRNNNVATSGTVKIQVEQGSAATSWTPYSNICPISGHDTAMVTRTGKNLCEGVVEHALGLTNNNTQLMLMSNAGTCLKFRCKSGVTYTVSGCPDMNRYMAGIFDSDPNIYDVGTRETIISSTATSFTFTASKTGICLAYVANSVIDTSTAIIELSSVPSSYEPYQAQQVTIDLDGTRYGGELNVLTGTMTVDKAMLTLTGTEVSGWSDSKSSYAGSDAFYYSLPDAKASSYPYTSYLIRNGWSGIVWSCQINANKVFIMFVEKDKFADASAWKTYLSSNNLQVCYELAAPLTVQLTPQQVNSLLGENHIWADTGDTEVTYRTDTKLYIDSKVAQTAKVTRKMIADSATADGKAPKSLATGDLIIVGDELRKATANIGNGSAITASNSTTATLADVIKALQ